MPISEWIVELEEDLNSHLELSDDRKLIFRHAVHMQIIADVQLAPQTLHHRAWEDFLECHKMYYDWRECDRKIEFDTADGKRVILVMPQAYAKDFCDQINPHRAFVFNVKVIAVVSGSPNDLAVTSFYRYERTHGSKADTCNFDPLHTSIFIK